MRMRMRSWVQTSGNRWGCTEAFEIIGISTGSECFPRVGSMVISSPSDCLEYEPGADLEHGCTREKGHGWAASQVLAALYPF